MLLREYLLAVGSGYDRRAGFDTDAQRLLARAADHLGEYGPADFLIRASGGQNPLGTTDTPWIGFFNPDESTSPQAGLYVVWILRADGSAWTVSVNMGTERLYRNLTQHDKEAPSRVPRESRVLHLLRTEAAAIRSRLPTGTTSEWDSSIDLRGGGTRQRRYEAATVLARTYSLPELPSEESLRSDIGKLCVALDDAIRVRGELAVTDPGSISTASKTMPSQDLREYIFSPGVDSPSVIPPTSRPIQRTPRHETGLRRYGEWLIGHGEQVATNVHPLDFIVGRELEWIGEYKVVYGANVARASREALSQLKEYQFFRSGTADTLPLLAVFSAPITERRVRWLNSEGVAVVWREQDDWLGCPIAIREGLASSS